MMIAKSWLKMINKMDEETIRSLYFKCGVCDKIKPIKEARRFETPLKVVSKQKEDSMEVEVSLHMILACKDCANRITWVGKEKEVEAILK